MSITHHHLLAVLNSEIAKRSDRNPQAPIRILDMGCGSGQLLGFLQTRLKATNFELYGFDICDAIVQEAGFLEKTLESLRQAAPEVDWSKRIFSIHSSEAWPFADGFFDFVISNQVFEHVADPDFALGQIARVLAAGGVSAHLFPLSHYFYEGHLWLPLVHWIHDHDLLYWWIRACYRLGIGKYRVVERQAKEGGAQPESLERYAERHADYMAFYTHYLTRKEILRLAKKAGLRCSFRYTNEFYLAKIRALLGKQPRLLYDLPRFPLAQRAAFALLSRASCITMRLEKTNTYWTAAGFSLAESSRSTDKQSSRLASGEARD
jgi:SAM-dependent methyltransferase